MTDQPQEPTDAAARRAVPPVICYPTETLPRPDLNLHRAARVGAQQVGGVTVSPREGRCFRVPAGHFFRITVEAGTEVSVVVLDATGMPRMLRASNRWPSKQMWKAEEGRKGPNP